ncbi:class I SAM-dependent methyltransferase [Nocardiopsis sp. RSe5-2]|uniref:Class I SAM-dependent methyltransferase n=1 Tax=Nocardiopsis endophytica TaxID=3018445 RepID=A0ABT4U8H7_9ACTN|nr:class I SAM-dependent methyltransferase [Nocardiopsis endophytica]MDA2813262.1 class I SAM-dependent methyltransferase [Nocardiopsis endophytica]
MTRDGGLAGIYRWAELYEDVYSGRGKDYAADAERVAAIITERRPGAVSLLDAACGTGAHLRHLADRFDTVEGVDLAEDMLRVARERLPGTALHTGDMRDFRLGRRFDAVTCMFSSIGYTGGAEGVRATLASFARHLEPGGVIVLEPWYFPETALDRHVVADTFTVGARTVSRVSRAVLEDGAHRMEVHYIVADRENGIRHFTDEHVLAVVAREEYERAFEEAGCAVEYLPGDGPGLFVGVAKGGG